MIELQIIDNKLTVSSQNILDTAVETALNASLESIRWTISDEIIGLGTSENILYRISCNGDWNDDKSAFSLTGLKFESTEKPIFEYQITPLNEYYIQSQLVPDEHEPQSQLGRRAEVIQDMFESDIDKCTTPKAFLNIFDFDHYWSRLKVTLEESILFWMECNTASIKLDDDPNIDRVYMFGAARNQVIVDFKDGTTEAFRHLNPSTQVEICYKILSI